MKIFDNEFTLNAIPLVNWNYILMVPPSIAWLLLRKNEKRARFAQNQGIFRHPQTLKLFKLTCGYLIIVIRGCREKKPA